LLTALAAVTTVVSYWREGRAEAEGVRAKFYCPMHPQITSDGPGECPICQMTLEPIPADRQKVGAPPSAPPSAPPHAPPSAPSSARPAAPVPAPPAAARPPEAPPNTTTVTLSLDRVQAIGVRTAVVAERDVGAALRVTATVAAPEQGAASVHVRASG